MKKVNESKSEKVYHNSNKKYSLIIICIAVVVIGLIVFFVVRNHYSSTNSYSASSSNQQSSSSSSNNRQPPVKTEPTCRSEPYQEQEAYTKTEYYTETVPYTAQECQAKKLGYSVTDFTLVSNTCNQKLEECTDYTLGFCTSKIKYCVDRTVVCSLRFNNLDTETRGIWEVRIDFKKSGSSNVADSDNGNLAVYPSDSGTYSFTGRITTKEPYEQSYTCDYHVLTEATKQICRDVIKYREVQRSREVTAYRPVTKYKQVCDGGTTQ